ncbi:MAG: PQQ-dependent sugar dehydrogenase [Chloroflexi bacterium]|nr:PQQ-dependent sugar dehydrogenase [Chloroflexota bacterium]
MILDMKMLWPAVLMLVVAVACSGTVPAAPVGSGADFSESRAAQRLPADPTPTIAPSTPTPSAQVPAPPGPATPTANPSPTAVSRPAAPASPTPTIAPPTATPVPPSPPVARPLSELAVREAFPELSMRRMTAMAFPKGIGDRLYVALQEGRILAFSEDPAANQAKEFLDIRKRVEDRGNEEGLLGLTFDPTFSENGYFYVYYTAPGPRRSVISRFAADVGRRGKVDPSSEVVILEVPQPFRNHNGGQIAFGPDGFLYVALGDGGSSGDPAGNGQNTATLLGSILRIDVAGLDDAGRYKVPKDNPFVGRKGARAEIWAYGLRNIWRMSFDRETGLLWGADVGQNGWEEVDIIVKGGNYGWNKREGKHAYRGGKKTDKMIDPVAEYDRAKGISITGGYVYRGKKLKELVGVYVYADYFTGRIWGLTYDVKKKKVIGNELMAHEQRKYIASFGEDAKKELYACCFDGSIYRFEIVKGSD